MDEDRGVEEALNAGDAILDHGSPCLSKTSLSESQNRSPPPTENQMASREEQLRALTSLRWRVALVLTALMTGTYFGFMLLVAYAKEWLTATIVPGLSRGIALGAGTILAAWLLIFVYVMWANSSYDPKIRAIREGDKS